MQTKHAHANAFLHFTRTNTAQDYVSWGLTQEYGIFYFSEIAEIDNTNITVYLASLTEF